MTSSTFEIPRPTHGYDEARTPWSLYHSNRSSAWRSTPNNPTRWRYELVHYLYIPQASKAPPPPPKTNNPMWDITTQLYNWQYKCIFTNTQIYMYFHYYYYNVCLLYNFATIKLDINISKCLPPLTTYKLINPLLQTKIKTLIRVKNTYPTSLVYSIKFLASMHKCTIKVGHIKSPWIPWNQISTKKMGLNC